MTTTQKYLNDEVECIGEIEELDFEDTWDYKLYKKIYRNQINTLPDDIQEFITNEWQEGINELRFVEGDTFYNIDYRIYGDLVYKPLPIDPYIQINNRFIEFFEAERRGINSYLDQFEFQYSA